jgi:signal transduction histidine kinase
LCFFHRYSPFFPVHYLYRGNDVIGSDKYAGEEGYWRGKNFIRRHFQGYNRISAGFLACTQSPNWLVINIKKATAMDTASSESLDRHDRGLNFVFLVIVIAGYIQAFTSSAELPTLPTILVMIGGGVIYTLIGIFGIQYFDRAESAIVKLLYFIIQIALIGALNQFLGFDVELWLLTLPLVSQAVIMLPRGQLLMVCGVILLVFIGPVVPLADIGMLISYVFTFLATMVFVAVFTHIVLSERLARREVERLAGELGEANQRLREYATQIEDLATMEERNRLAREIHDSLGHYLTVINVQLEAARAVMKSDHARALDALEKAQSLTKEGLSEVRRSVAALRASPIEGKSLPDLIESLIEECRAAGMIAEFTLSGEHRTVSVAQKQTLFRAAQEGLTNVRRHAKASRVDVLLGYEDEKRVRLHIEDNGVGVDPDELESGFGLLGIRERVQLLGGKVRVEGMPNQGFVLEVELET